LLLNITIYRLQVTTFVTLAGVAIFVGYERIMIEQIA
jgi:hypothetical protein